jgi:membrane protein DedA with SNARE-associated domain/rhodanese-related sulfurtransferase
MQHIITGLEHHVLWIVFFNILLTQIGVPVPVLPTLMTAAALAGQNPYQLGEIVIVGAGAALLGDLAPYWYGRRFGRRILRLLCKVSISPDFCVLRTETMFAKLGPWSLLFAKFIPGFSLISVAMAGITRMSLAAFLLLDGAGKLLFVSGVVAVGVLFQHAIASALSTLKELGEFGVVAVIAVFALYVLGKWWRRQLFMRQLRMDRITVAELCGLIDDGEQLTILDVRPKEVRALEGVIPGAIAAHPADIDPVLANHPRESEIVIYCACPNEASAAIAAKHLKQAGFKKIRPLLGGIDAWIEAGRPIDRVESVAEEAVSPLDANPEAACASPAKPTSARLLGWFGLFGPAERLFGNLGV